MQILEFRQTEEEENNTRAARGWRPINEMVVKGFREKTAGVAIRGTYMGTAADKIHTCGQKGSAGKSL